MAEEANPSNPQAAPLESLAKKPDAQKPPQVSNKEWRRHRMAAGQMIIIRSHFKSIYLIPMAIISAVLGIFAATMDSASSGHSTLGLIWIGCFCLYMNMFIFEWTRAWTFALVLSVVVLVLLGMVLNDDTDFPVWGTLENWLRDLNITFSTATYWFFAIFFSLCALISYIRTRLNYIVVESNEIQLYRNALFGDRERISMLNPRVEVRVPDMLEYFHPFYGAGQIIIHAPDRSIVLDNVLNIRRLERATDRLGSSLSVRLSHD